MHGAGRNINTAVGNGRRYGTVLHEMPLLADAIAVELTAKSQSTISRDLSMW